MRDENSSQIVSITPGLVLRRFTLWLAVCGASAAPSFAIASMDRANRAGMIVGVLLFVLAYTTFTSTPRFQGFYEKPHIRQTLRFGYGVRLLASAVAAIGAVAPDSLAWLMLPDFFCGMLSVVAGSVLTGRTGAESIRTFEGALLVTCVQGALLNVIVFLLMLCFYATRRHVARRKERRGFEVIPVLPATTTSPEQPPVITRRLD